MTKETCDICKTGTISYSNLKKAKDAEGKEVAYREVSCSTRECVINGMKDVVMGGKADG